MTAAEKRYINEVYAKKDTALKPDVRKIVDIYNREMPDGKHVFHPLNNNMCACNLRPYVVQLYNKIHQKKK